MESGAVFKLNVVNVFQCHPTNRYFNIPLVSNAKGQKATSYSFCQLDEASMKLVNAFDEYHRQKIGTMTRFIPRITHFNFNSVLIPVVFIHSNCDGFHREYKCPIPVGKEINVRVAVIITNYSKKYCADLVYEPDDVDDDDDEEEEVASGDDNNGNKVYDNIDIDDKEQIKAWKLSTSPDYCSCKPNCF